MGIVGNGTDIGVFLHPMLLIDAYSGACLGLSSIYHWNRYKAKNPNYKKLPIEEKESFRWIENAISTIDALKANGNKVTIIANRESDIYEEWVRIPSDEVHLLTRSRCDRVLFGCKDSLYNYSDNLEVAGQYDLFLRGIRGKRQKRNTVVNVRYSEVRLRMVML